MPPLKRSGSFLDASQLRPSKPPRLHIHDLDSKPHQPVNKLSDEGIWPIELGDGNTLALARPPRPSNLTGQQDTHLTLGQIHNHDSSALISQMLEIQKFTISRDESEEWAANLRFLYVEKLGPRGQLRHIPLTRKGEYQNHSNYVAVSYRWQYPSDPEPNPAYLIFDADGDQRGNKAPNAVLNRAINYAQENGIPLIWIDQECIPNRDDCPEEHDIAIQAMDIVYRRSDHPLGLLKSKLLQKHILLLHELFSRRAYRNQISNVECWVVPPSQEELSQIRDLLHKILIDDWWDRAWIFQEKYCGSVKMKVGLPYGTLDDYSHNGHSPGEFYFKPVYFRRIVTLFRPELERFDPEFGALLDKAKQYTILNKYNASEGVSASQFKACSTEIISDIDGGSCERAMDRLAIIANCCRYSRRLDCRRLSNLYNLSTCILTLFLLNGELLRYSESNPDFSTLSTVRHDAFTVHKFLKEYSLSFVPPGSKGQLSFIHNCRLPSVSLTMDGIETSGWMWDMAGPLLFIQLPEWFSLYFCQEANIKKLHEPFLDLICRELPNKGCGRLARQIQEFSREEENRSKTEDLSSDHLKEQMIDALLVAVNKGKVLRLACLAGEKEPSAIFITPTNNRELFPAAAKVFTSWCKRKSDYHHPNFVSLLVQQDGTSSAGEQRVRTQEWINGLWFAKKDEGFGKVVFSWPF